MVWWKAVSNTPTCGMSGSSAFTAFTPLMLAGLCKGARSLHSAKAFMTSGVSSTLLLNFSPPCTMRWPTASSSFRFFNTAYSPVVSTSKMYCTPAVCSSMGRSMRCFSPFSLTVMNESGKPIFSMPPLVMTLWSSML